MDKRTVLERKVSQGHKAKETAGRRNDIEAIQRTGLFNRKYMTWPMLKETIAKSKSR